MESKDDSSTPRTSEQTQLEGEEEDIEDYHYGGYHPCNIGDTFKDGRYVIVRKLGWGYFSTVWLARDTVNNGEFVALKIVRSAKNYTETALDEVKLLKTIANSDKNHPGIKYVVRLLDEFIHSGPNGDHVCMVFEVLGENLLSLMRRYHYKGLPVKLVKQITVQVMLALDYLHRKCGIIHTDLKPENVLIKIKYVDNVINQMDAASIKSAFIDNGKGTPKITNSQPLPSPLKMPLRKIQSELIKNVNGSTGFGYNNTPSRQDGINSLRSKSQAQSNLPRSHTPTNTFDLRFSSDDILKSVGSSKAGDMRKNIETDTETQIKTKTQPQTQTQTQKEPKNETETETETDTGTKTHIGTETETETEVQPQPYTQSYSQTGLKTETNQRFHLGSDVNTVYNENNDNEFNDNDSDNDSDITALEDDRIVVKIADFGNACTVDHHFTEDIQTRQYRSPEVLLGGKWGAGADCWSLACMVFELLSGDYLFEPQSGKTYTKDEDHIAQVMELLGPLPPILFTGKNVPLYFDKQFHLLNISKLKVWPLPYVLVGKYDFEESEVKKICELLLPLLDLNPENRSDCGSLLKKEWLLGQPNYDHIVIDRDPNAKSGNDIRGWSSEAAPLTDVCPSRANIS